MKLFTLGGLGLADTSLTRVKPLLLLAYVALEGSKDRHHLAELFWPHAADPLNSLAVALKHLRQFAPGAAVGDHTHVSSAVGCDAITFLQAADTGHYEEALRIYQGPFLSGIYLKGWSAELEEWVYGTREFLAGRARNALLRSGEEIAANGNFEDAAKYAETAYLLPGAPELEPEEVTRLHALLVAGNSPHLARLRKDAQGYGIELSLAPAAAREQLRRPLGGSPAPTQTLPTRGTSFIGRDAELVEVANRLTSADCSLLTLTGPGGVGKSRLAVRVAQDLSERYPGGVYFVALEALGDASLVPTSIAGVLGLSLRGGEDPLVQVTRHIGNRAVLLVLDNYEHLLDGATLAAQLIQNCPNLKLLVTSRERLNLEEEWVLPLEGFAVPTETVSLSDSIHHDVLRLFEDRAKRSRLSFELTPQELPHVVSICNQVQGLPLGIELAAAWVKMLSCQEIAQEIERKTEILSSKSRNVPERHKSIRAVFEHSWRLLTPKEQEVLRRLSVFQGGFRREAAAEVAGATIPMLASLVDKSLLRVTGSGRYYVHPLLHQYAREKLSKQRREQSQTGEKHVGYYLALAERSVAQLRGPEGTLWLDRLEEEHDNLRAALDWTEACGHAEVGLQLAGALRPFWATRGFLHEGHERLRRALSQSGASKQTLARAEALNGAGLLARYQSDYASAQPLHEESLAIRRELEDKWGVADTLFCLGFLAFDQGDYASARPTFEESLEIRRKLKDERGVADSLLGVGYVALNQGDYASARPAFEESLAIRWELGDKRGIAHSLGGLGYIAIDETNYASARSYLEEAIAIYQEAGDKRGIASSLERFAALHVVEGKAEQAAQLWGAGEALRELIGSPRLVSDRARDEKYLEAARAHLGQAVFSTAWTKGRTLPLEEATAYALEEIIS